MQERPGHEHRRRIMAVGTDSQRPTATGPVRLGLRANWPQFALLVVVNIFVGGMVGLERANTSLVGTRVFQLSGYLAVFSFIIAFGVTKALTNLVAGPLTARHTRKNLLVAGWAAGLPVPFVLAWAPAWGWIVAANVCLGVNQGLTSSMVVNMKMDLVGPKGRGLAMGLNEAAGYMAVGATALATGYLAAAYGLRPVPELIGAVYVAAGLALSAALVKDTAGHVAAETAAHAAQPGPVLAPGSAARPLWTVFRDTSWQSRPLRGASQAGLANNLNDGLTWAVFPLLFASHGLGLAAIGLIKGLYPMLWGGGQLFTGRLADTIGRRPMIVSGMMIQAAAFPAALLLLARPLVAGLVSAILLGIGTAMAQPALSAAVADHTHPSWRAQSLGVYRFWRDLGYAIGAVIAGLLAQAFNLSAAVIAGGVITFASGLLAARWISRGPSPVDGSAHNGRAALARPRSAGMAVAAGIACADAHHRSGPGREARTDGADQHRMDRRPGHHPGCCLPRRGHRHTQGHRPGRQDRDRLPARLADRLRRIRRSPPRGPRRHSRGRG
jgi:MFS family permease